MRPAGGRRRHGGRLDSCGSRSAAGARRRSWCRSRSTSSRRLSLLETPCSIFRWAIDRISSPLAVGEIGPLALVLVKDDDTALAARLGRHHGELGTGDELARVGGVLGAERDPDRERHRPGRVELGEGDPFRDTLGERMGDPRDRPTGRMIANSSPPVLQTSSLSRTTARSCVGELGQHLVPDGVPVDVVDPLEVVEIEHQERHRPTLGGAVRTTSLRSRS